MKSPALTQNQLELYIEGFDLDPVATMNLLQENGVVSDNCINAADVAKSDCAEAVKWLEAKRNAIQGV